MRSIMEMWRLLLRRLASGTLKLLCQFVEPLVEIAHSRVTDRARVLIVLDPLLEGAADRFEL